GQLGATGGGSIALIVPARDIPEPECRSSPGSSAILVPCGDSEPSQRRGLAVVFDPDSVPVRSRETSRMRMPLAGRVYAKIRQYESGHLGSLVPFGFSIFCLFAAFSPFSVVMPDFGLDPSWRAVLGDAPTLGIKIGRDIIFTGGPLSSLYTRWFD